MSDGEVVLAARQMQNYAQLQASAFTAFDAQQQCWLTTQEYRRHLRGWPRSDYDKRYRMTKFLLWKREQIAERWRRRARITVLLIVVPPLAVTACAALWRMALYAVLQ